MEELLALALDAPEVATRRAELVLGSRDPLARSYAFQALGIVRRERGDISQALSLLRSAVRAAAVNAEREADARATYAATLALAGRTAAALREFERARMGARGTTAATIAVRKAGVLATLGRYDEAGPLLAQALDDLADGGSPAWQARTRLWLAHLQLRRGNLDVAEVHTRAAIDVLSAMEGTADQFSALDTLAEIAATRGDLVTALRLGAEVVAGFVASGRAPRFEDVGNLAAAYLAAGLGAEAVAVLEGPFAGLTPVQAAECKLALSVALLATDQAQAAVIAARDASTQLRIQRRDWFLTRAVLAEVRARHRLGDTRPIERDARRVAALLDEERADEAPVALTLAGRLAEGEERGELWRQAASYRNHPNALVRASAWLARALEREEAGDRGGALRACRAGLDAIDEQRRLLGSSELRAQATTHGRELTEVALRAAARDPRRLLGWAERTRATTLAQPRMTSDAATIPESLAALRDNGRQLAEARAAGELTERLERERLRLERAVRTESHTVSATDAGRDRPVTAAEVVGGVGDGCLVELVDVGGALHVLVVHAGKVRRRIAGPTADALALLDPVAMLLRRSARGRPAATDQIGRRLQDAILGDAARLIPDGPVVLAPTTRLHGLPWAVLPALTDRPFSVVPSAGQWLRAGALNRPQERRTVLVCGPGLQSGGAEVPLLAEQHPTAQLLAGKEATLEAVLETIDGADLVHLAAHGHFRADSPLFSSLDLADGPLTVHELERIGRAPYRVVLSACESGVLAPVGAQELLGLAAALFGLGTAGLACSVAEVNDAATAELMVGLHAGLAAGQDPATALWEVRRQAADPVSAATAAAFLALGV